MLYLFLQSQIKQETGYDVKDGGVLHAVHVDGAGGSDAAGEGPAATVTHLVVCGVSEESEIEVWFRV